MRDEETIIRIGTIYNKLKRVMDERMRRPDSGREQKRRRMAGVGFVQ